MNPSRRLFLAAAGGAALSTTVAPTARSDALGRPRGYENAAYGANCLVPWPQTPSNG
ncbi:hypothetical protein [Natrinema soli]|uniref:hypothetical protein n=1 Tax=Natrinema soli TaxID=1930624 RepID=UPI00236199EF|nr:hypothetical protein [Natrinema soli]